MKVYPSNSIINVNQITGVLPVVNGGTGVTTSTGTANVVLSASPTLTGAVAVTGTLATTSSVGIGTTSGSARLSVNGGTSTSQIRFEVNNAAFTQEVSTDATASAYVYKSNDASFHVWKTSSSEGMRLDSNQNLGLGTASPGITAILDVQSTTKGVRFPNMTTAQKNAITPGAGTMVFDTTLAKLCVYSGAAWQTVTSA